jgi:hypothetical protein
LIIGGKGFVMAPQICKNVAASEPWYASGEGHGASRFLIRRLQQR